MNWFEKAFFKLTTTPYPRYWIHFMNWVYIKAVKLWGSGAFFLPPQGMYYPVCRFSNILFLFLIVCLVSKIYKSTQPNLFIYGIQTLIKSHFSLISMFFKLNTWAEKKIYLQHWHGIPLTRQIVSSTSCICFYIQK